MASTEILVEVHEALELGEVVGHLRELGGEE